MNFPQGIIPITKAREVVGNRHYYPAKDVTTKMYRHHKYYLILWRPYPQSVEALGMAYEDSYPGLKWVDSMITFYLDPKDTSSHSVDRYGLYVRMGK